MERVGLGAFGAVWRARDTELDRIVALKIPHAGSLTEEADRARDESRRLAQVGLRHDISAAARGIREDGLAVGDGENGHQADDHNTYADRIVKGCGTGQNQDQQDFFRGVGN